MFAKKESKFEMVMRLAKEARNNYRLQIPGLEFYSVITRKSEHPEFSSNGGDYDFGYTFAVYNGEIIAAYFWTSADFEYCSICGSFQNDSDHYDRFHGNNDFIPEKELGDWKNFCYKHNYQQREFERFALYGFYVEVK